MIDPATRYKASVERNGAYAFAVKCSDERDQMNFLLAEEHRDFCEFLVDIYLDGGKSEFDELWSRFKAWQEENEHHHLLTQQTPA